MRLDRLTNKFQLALADAQSLALGHDNQFIEPLHLMSALLNQRADRYVRCSARRERMSLTCVPASKPSIVCRRSKGPTATFSHQRIWSGY